VTLALFVNDTVLDRTLVARQVVYRGLGIALSLGLGIGLVLGIRLGNG